MNCQRIQESFIDYQSGALPAPESAEVREHLKSCLNCQRDWAGLQATLLQLDRLPLEEPSPRLRANFYTMLEEHRRAADDPGPFALMRTRIDRFFEAFVPARPAMQFAFSLALLVAGLIYGSRYLPQSVSPAIDPATAQKLADLQARVDSMDQRVNDTLAFQRSTSERLKGVLATVAVKDPDQHVLNDLIAALALDPSTNVRLSALEALYPHGERSEVRAGVLASLPRETSPIVQVSMIDFLAAQGYPQAAPTLQTLARNESLDQAVRDAAKRALAQM